MKIEAMKKILFLVAGLTCVGITGTLAGRGISSYIGLV